MAAIRTYIDANVLIAAFQGKENIAHKALQVLDDPERKLVVSDYLKLEVFPKPVFYKRAEEIEFMQAIIDDAENIETSPELTKLAIKLASDYDLSPVDALHVGAATIARVDEMVTLEKTSKTMFKVDVVKIVSIRSD